jgi:hypothetical protein
MWKAIFQNKLTIYKANLPSFVQKIMKRSLLCGHISQTSAEKPPKNGDVRKANWVLMSVLPLEITTYRNSSTSQWGMSSLYITSFCVQPQSIRDFNHKVYVCCLKWQIRKYEIIIYKCSSIFSLSQLKRSSGSQAVPGRCENENCLRN